MKSIGLEDVPDMGQGYWALTGRAGSGKRYGPLKLFGIAFLAAALAVSAGYAEGWAIDHGHAWIVKQGFAGLAFMVMLLAGVVALGVFTVASEETMELWRLRRAPEMPERYSPEMAETAWRLERAIATRDRLLAEGCARDVLIAELEGRIASDFARIDDYRRVMDETNIDALTLRS